MTWYFGYDDKLGEIDILVEIDIQLCFVYLLTPPMALNASFVAKLNAWKKAVKNSWHVTGSLRNELYLLTICTINWLYAR